MLMIINALSHGIMLVSFSCVISLGIVCFIEELRQIIKDNRDNNTLNTSLNKGITWNNTYVIIVMKYSQVVKYLRVTLES